MTRWRAASGAGDTGAMGRPAVRAGALAVALAAAATGCVGHQAVAGASPAGLGFNPARDGGYVTGGPAPVLTGTTLTATALSTARYAGKVLVINFWASWCGPCRTEAPAFQAVYAASAGKPVAFVGVLFQDTAANGRSFDLAQQITYPSLLDPSGLDLVKFRRYGLVSVPDTVVVGRDGRVVAAFSGPVEQSTLQTVVDRELAA
jgi:thiol-disulfide isomerase/thioredoxin